MNFHQHYQPSFNPTPNSNNSRFSLSSDASSVLLKTRFPNLLQRDESLVEEDRDLERTVMFATDDPLVLRGLSLNFDDDSWKCHDCSSLDELIKPLAKGSIEVVVICESILNDKEDFSKLQEILKHNPLTAVIAIVDQADSEAARALKEMEVFEIFTKPFNPKAILFSAYDAVAEFFGDLT